LGSLKDSGESDKRILYKNILSNFSNERCRDLRIHYNVTVVYD